jgi:hypothetical protein
MIYIYVIEREGSALQKPVPTEVAFFPQYFKIAAECITLLVISKLLRQVPNCM